jgi:hypothetical protein
MPEYTHTLIPDRVDFVPEPKQVGTFLSSLVSIGAAPLKSAICLSKLSGEVRTLRNPFTGKSESLPMRKSETLKDIAAVPNALAGIDDYTVIVSGKGPPKLAAFAFDFKGTYDFAVHCCRRPEVVSTSDPHDEVPVERKVEFFGRPCDPKDRMGVFHNPNTLEVIEVPGAACALFWIEFEFGKMLFPKIEDRLDLIDPEIIEVAENHFGTKFVQGCCWCA